MVEAQVRARCVSSGGALLAVLHEAEGGAGSEIPDMCQVCQPGVTELSDSGCRARQHEAGLSCS